MKNAKQKAKLAALIRLVIFVIVFSGIFWMLEKHFFSAAYVNPMWTYAADAESEPIDILFVGNSHTYCTVDTEVLSLATGLNVRSLACSAINGEIVEADLSAFLKYQQPRIVVLEMCPFTVSNFDTMENERVGVVFQHFDGIPNLFDRLEAVSKITGVEQVPAGVFQLLRNSEMWTRWSDNSKNRTNFNSYGVIRRNNVQYLPDFSSVQVSQAQANYVPKDGTELINPRQAAAFERILELSKQYGFDIWIYNAPLSYFSRDYANSVQYMRTMQSAFSDIIRYVDDAMLYLPQIGISKTDFHDDSHLNANGMAKVTQWLLSLIDERLGCGKDISAIARCRDMKITLLEDGRYRYEANAWGEAQYRFQYSNAAGERLEVNDSLSPCFEEEAIQPSLIRVYIKPSIADKQDISGQQSCVFLKYTLEAYQAKQDAQGALFLQNKSDFADDLLFGWIVTNTSNGETEIYDYQEGNTLSLPFPESGVYVIDALLKQGDAERHSAGVLTVVYDAQSQTLTVTDKADSVECDI